MQSGALQPRRRRTRRYGFLALLLLALAAPAGFVTAGEATRPYVVLFDNEAVSVADDAANLALSGASLPFRDAARSESVPLSRASATLVGVGGQRRIDSKRVEGRVREIAARSRLSHIGSVYSSAVGGFAADLTVGQLARISADPTVSAVLPDVEVSLDDAAGADATGAIEGGTEGRLRQTSDPVTRVPPGIRRVGARTSLAASISGRDRLVDVDVAVIDTGIQRHHPDLNVVGGYNCTSRKRDKWDDNEGHGTHVAGTIGALNNGFGVTGVAPGVRLWSVKVLNSRGHGYLSWVVCGVDWVTAQRDPSNHARPLIEVANMSLSFTLPGANDADCGRPTHDTLHLAICRSVEKGTTYVVAAGNESRNARRNRPAAYDEVITVSAMADYDGRPGGRGYASESCPYWSPERDDAFARFSNFGPDVDLIAPGKCILSTFKGSRYAWMSGTSMATPHVAGVAALYKAMFPRATPEQVRLGLVAAARLNWRTATDPDGSPEPAVWVGNFRAMPDFSLSLPESVSVARGGSTSVRLALSRSAGFSAPISVSLAAGPKAVSGSQVTVRYGAATLTVSAAPGLRRGRYTLTFRAVSGDLSRSASMTLVVGGEAAQATISWPPAGDTTASTPVVRVDWSERGGTVVTRRLTRLAGRVRTSGTCAGVRFRVELTRRVTGPRYERVRSGYCYRWQLTWSDETGTRSSATSGNLLVDTSAPHAPSLNLAGRVERTPNLAKLDVEQTYVDRGGDLWVRAGVSGRAAVQVSARDRESGILRNIASVDGGRGWSTHWVGSSEAGALVVRYSRSGGSAKLSVSSVNGAGLTGPATVAGLLRDGSAPSTPTWLSAVSGATRTINGTYFKLNWSAATDTGSGVTERYLVARYKSSLSASGACRPYGFSSDGAFQLLANNAWDSGLEPSSCYVWTLRALDNVGNVSEAAISGYVITRAKR